MVVLDQFLLNIFLVGMTKEGFFLGHVSHFFGPWEGLFWDLGRFPKKRGFPKKKGEIMCIVYIVHCIFSMGSC